jgi:glucokinase
MEALGQDNNTSKLHTLVRAHGEITSRDIFDAAAYGDALAEKIVEDTAYYLAVGSMNVMHIIDPNMVCFAGGMIAAGESFLERIRYHVKELAFPVPAAHTEIRYAQLGSDAGYIGAAACARKLYKSGLR